MAYERVNWENLPSTNTPVNADNLNKMDKGIANAVEKNDLLNLIYPVGSIYMSVNSTSPATLFGGEWEQIKGRFLLGTGSLESNNNDRFGQVTEGQVNVPAGEKGGETYHKLTINEMPKHKHNSKIRISWYDTAAKGLPDNQTNSSYVGIDRERIYTDEVGGDNSHNNIPPYFAVYIWKRTA